LIILLAPGHLSFHWRRLAMWISLLVGN